MAEKLTCREFIPGSAVVAAFAPGLAISKTAQAGKNNKLNIQFKDKRG